MDMNERDSLALLEERLNTVRRRKAVRSVVIELLVTVAAIALLFGVICGVAFVEGDSMEPALHNGDVVLFFRLQHSYRVGDIALLEKDGNRDYIKRVVAVPGQTVDIDNKAHCLLVDGVAQDEPYSSGETIRKTGCTYPLTLGEGEYFVLGDARENSVDSRNFGVVEQGQLRGRVVALLRIGCR